MHTVPGDLHGMKLRPIIQCAIAVILISIGFTVGRAQTPGPAFELTVDAPGGETTIKCVRGCELAWVERALNANSMPRMQTFTYKCSGPRCPSGRVGGWLSEQR